ncbi:MAG: M23 family metallopeptidase [Candidatus Hydrogenedentota bacterium]
MKKWTLLVIPEDQGNTSTLQLHAFYLWAAVGVLVLLTFTSAFFYKRYQISQEDMEHLAEWNRQMQMLQVSEDNTASAEELDAELIQELGQRIRSQYEARDNAITEDLNALYDLESQVRQVHGLPPRSSLAVPPPANGDSDDGRGGGPSLYRSAAAQEDPMMARPPTLIYGASRPSADLIVQEINIRMESLEQLLDNLEEKQNQVARTPAIQPTNHPNARVSSNFGYREDPFSHSLRHHDGMDFSAPPGSDVLATGQGTVIKAEYEGHFGNMVEIDHGDGQTTVYGHMQELLVSPGEEVERGDVIGLVGSTGRSTGPHIHYEVRRDGQPVDPSSYLGS